MDNLGGSLSAQELNRADQTVSDPGEKLSHRRAAYATFLTKIILGQKIYNSGKPLRFNIYRNGLIILSFASTRRLCFMSSV